MADLERLRLEKGGMSDRDLLLTIAADMSDVLERETTRNGLLHDLMSDYYGSLTRKIKGSKPQTEKNTVAIDRGKTAFKTVMILFGALGISNAMLLFRLIGG